MDDLGCFRLAALLQGRPAHAAGEVKLDKDFLDGVVAKLPPTSFEKAGQVSRRRFTRIGSSRSTRAPAGF